MSKDTQNKWQSQKLWAPKSGLFLPLQCLPGARHHLSQPSRFTSLSSLDTQETPVKRQWSPFIVRSWCWELSALLLGSPGRARTALGLSQNPPACLSAHRWAVKSPAGGRASWGCCPSLPSALPPPALVPHYSSSCRIYNTASDLLGSTFHGMEAQRRREPLKITPDPGERGIQ